MFKHLRPKWPTYCKPLAPTSSALRKVENQQPTAEDYAFNALTSLALLLRQ
jgi:hypothetical protein